MDQNFKPALEDKVVFMLLITPSDTDFTYERPDGTRYVLEIRKGKEDYYYVPEHQCELKLSDNCGKKPFKWNMNESKPQPPMDFSTPWPHNRG